MKVEKARPRVRSLDPTHSQDIELIACRMRETLIEVLGEERGVELYSLESLEDRVREHLDPGRLTGQVYIAEDTDGAIVGHTIVRLDDDGFGNEIGLFSTVFVAPEMRRRGIATALILQGHRWMVEHHLVRAVTYTDAGNLKLQRLFEAHGYSISAMPRNFVALTRTLGSSPGLSSETEE